MISCDFRSLITISVKIDMGPSETLKSVVTMNCANALLEYRNLGEVTKKVA